MADDDALTDKDRVFRRLLHSSRTAHKHYKLRPPAAPEISSQGFTDRTQRTSVDSEAILTRLGLSASFTAEDNLNGVAVLGCTAVRAISVSLSGAPHRADITREPVVGNEAHCTIGLVPPSKNAFRKFIESLARTAAWEIHPADAR